MKFNSFRFEYLLGMWNAEIKLYLAELSRSKFKDHQKLARKGQMIDEDLVHKLLKLYLCRCKYKNALAFLQFRRLLPEPKIDELLEIFENRKSHLICEIELLD